MRLWKIALLVLACMAGAAFYYVYNPTEVTLVPRCLFKQLTGWSCPGCGMQRFLHAMLHGRVFEAISYNYLLVFLLPYTSLFALEQLVLTGKAQQRLKAIVEGKVMTYFCCIMAPAWTLLRNILNI